MNKNIIYRTVTFEIEPSGDCGKCEAKERLSNYCNAFRVGINTVVGNADGSLSLKPSQCKACREYLEAEKAKVYCDGCKKLSKDKYSCAFHLYSQGFTPNSGKPYRLNCKDREE